MCVPTMMVHVWLSRLIAGGGCSPEPGDAAATTGKSQSPLKISLAGSGLLPPFCLSLYWSLRPAVHTLQHADCSNSRHVRCIFAAGPLSCRTSVGRRLPAGGGRSSDVPCSRIRDRRPADCPACTAQPNHGRFRAREPRVPGRVLKYSRRTDEYRRHSNTTPWVTQCVTWKLLCYDCVITFVLSLCNRLVSHCV